MKTTISNLIDNTNIPAALVRAVVRQLGGWDSFKESAPDIANHGINGGFLGFFYYTDTVKFAKAHKADILAYARDMARDIGEPGAYSLIAGFNCLRDLKLSGDEVADCVNNSRHEDYTQVMNALAWFAGEEVARAYADMLETA